MDRVRVPLNPSGVYTRFPMNPPIYADDERHGKSSTYNNWGCRCEACTKAWNIAHQEYMFRSGRTVRTIEQIRAENEADRQAFLADLDDPRHGSESSYKRGCRCAKCRQATTDARKRRRWNSIEATREYDRQRRDIFEHVAERKPIVWQNR